MVGISAVNSTKQVKFMVLPLSTNNSGPPSISDRGSVIRIFITMLIRLCLKLLTQNESHQATAARNTLNYSSIRKKKTTIWIEST